MKTVFYIATLTLLSLFSGCIRDKFAPSDSPINFESSIDGADVVTRNADTGWSPDDVIGVYMVSSGGTIANHTLSVNAMHRHVGGGNFIAEPGHELFYPRMGKVDFVAYHPWRPTYDDHRYPIDVGDQSDHSAIDFKFSNNARRHSSGDVPFLEFRHLLSKLVFNVRDVSGAPLDGIAAVIDGLRTRGVFYLSDGMLALKDDSRADIAPIVVDDGDRDEATTRLEAIVLPESGLAPVVTFNLKEDTAARLNLVDKVYMGGKIYIYNVAVTAPGKVVLTGGTVIIDWDDQNRNPDEYTVPRTGSDGKDPVDPDTLSNQRTRYFRETMGSGADDDTPIKIDAYTEWDNSSVQFSDRFGGADVRRHGSIDAHIYFPPATDADISISGLPEDYTDITLSYDITAVGAGGVRANLIRVYAGTKNVTSQVTKIIPSPNRYTRVSIDIPNGVTSLRFVSDASVNIHGMRLDNIALEGRK